MYLKTFSDHSSRVGCVFFSPPRRYEGAARACNYCVVGRDESAERNVGDTGHGPYVSSVIFHRCAAVSGDI